MSSTKGGPMVTYSFLNIFDTLFNNNNSNNTVTNLALSTWHYPPGTHDKKARRQYPEYRATFVGFDSAGKCQRRMLWARTIEQCINSCVNMRRRYGKAWNGVLFDYKMVASDPRKCCFCLIGDSETSVWTNRFFHYRFY